MVVPFHGSIAAEGIIFIFSGPRHFDKDDKASFMGRCTHLHRLVVHNWYNEGRKEGNVLFNDALNTFYLRLYGVTHMVKDHSDNERGNPLPPHGLLFPIISKGSFICIIPQTG